MATDGGAPDEIELTVGDVHPQPRLQERHLWAQELVRASLAIAFFLLLALTVVWSLFQVGNAAAWTNAKEALQILLPVETALVGASTAFYYRARRD